MSSKSVQQKCQARVSLGGCGVACGVLGGCVLGGVVSWYVVWLGVLCGLVVVYCVAFCGVLVCGVVGCFVWSCCGVLCGVLCVGCGGLLCRVVCWIVVSLNANAWATLIKKKEQTIYAKIVLLHSGLWVLSCFQGGLLKSSEAAATAARRAPNEAEVRWSSKWIKPTNQQVVKCWPVICWTGFGSPETEIAKECYSQKIAAENTKEICCASFRHGAKKWLSLRNPSCLLLPTAPFAWFLPFPSCLQQLFLTRPFVDTFKDSKPPWEGFRVPNGVVACKADNFEGPLDWLQALNATVQDKMTCSAAPSIKNTGRVETEVKRPYDVLSVHRKMRWLWFSRDWHSISTLARSMVAVCSWQRGLVDSFIFFPYVSQRVWFTIRKYGRVELAAWTPELPHCWKRWWTTAFQAKFDAFGSRLKHSVPERSHACGRQLMNSSVRRLGCNWCACGEDEWTSAKRNVGFCLYRCSKYVNAIQGAQMWVSP